MIPPRGVPAMSIVRWALVVVTALVALGSIISYARHEGGAGAGTHRTSLFYCPMHPAVVQDHAGSCPICGMTLVPKIRTVDAENPPAEVAGMANIDLSAERLQLTGMRTAKVTRQALGGALRTTGAVAASERGLAQITARFGGWIQTLAVSETGQRVRRGQTLATIYSPEVLRAEQELLLAQRWNAPPPGGPPSDDEGLGAGARGRLELLGISPTDIDEVLRNGKAADSIAIRSPVDGYVVAKNVVAGAGIQPGSVLFEVADLTQVWVTAEIHESDIARLRVGQKARFEPSSFPGEVHSGKVQFISPTLDAATRTLRVRLAFPNTIDRNGPRLRPGMFGTVFLDLPSGEGLVVPAEAVVDTGESRYVFVATAGGHFQPRNVELGAQSNGQIQVVGGLVEGETVVTTGNFLLDSESRLRAAQQHGGAP